MPRQRSKKQTASRQIENFSAPELDRPQEEGSNSENGNESEIESLISVPKDEEEEDLERLVFGDGVGFQQMLGQIPDVDLENSNEETGAQDGEDGGLEHLFFLDSGPSAGDAEALILHQASEDTAGDAAWEDSEDERLTVSLAGNSRLRKLRLREDEDIISGSQYSRRLRLHYERLNSVPQWAQTSERPAKRRRRSSAGSDSSLSSNEMDVDSEELSALPLARLLQSAGSLTRTSASSMKRTKLRPEVLDIQQTRSIPDVQSSAVSSLSFHPDYPILLSSGVESTLYLHHIDPTAHPTPNPLLTAIKVGNTPLHSSAFLQPAGEKIFFSGRRRYFHIWDLPSGTIEAVTRVHGHKDEQKTMERFKLSPCGRYMALVGSAKKGGGAINILDATTTQWIASLRIEGANGVADYAWWGDGEGLTAVGKGSEVAEWSLATRSYVARWIDDGHAPTVLTLGGPNGPKSLGGDRWVVIGSQSGIVNIYDRRTFVSDKNVVTISERPQPKKSFDQFVTPTSNLTISPDGQILAFSSSGKKDALRLVHLPSCTVYRNWPTDKTPLGRITSVAFGKQSDMLAVGNKNGRVRMWEIRA
ncbi:hypothetical protein QTJ16_006563 [Diplocarpon rosae]|uniref:U3 small nucleolar RNA-associated protein 18 n=1 Tax=Diplocarpon rosae TaxID=946125 RepID=A0AAD9WCL5_9HELO|nr:hypothetical protein QTJ16_006563 [Diplocarpon rosae]